LDLVKLTLAKLYRLYCDPYAKFDDPTFDFIETLTNATYPMSWFYDLNGGKDAEYIYNLLGEISFLPFCCWCKRFATCQQGYFPIINQQGKRKM
jgi:hypothetical protein